MFDYMYIGNLFPQEAIISLFGGNWEEIDQKGFMQRVEKALQKLYKDKYTYEIEVKVSEGGDPYLTFFDGVEYFQTSLAITAGRDWERASYVTITWNYKNPEITVVLEDSETEAVDHINILVK